VVAYKSGRSNPPSTNTRRYPRTSTAEVPKTPRPTQHHSSRLAICTINESTLEVPESPYVPKVPKPHNRVVSGVRGIASTTRLGPHHYPIGNTTALSGLDKHHAVTIDIQRAWGDGVHAVIAGRELWWAEVYRLKPCGDLFTDRACTLLSLQSRCLHLTFFRIASPFLGGSSDAAQTCLLDAM
jgi:hypothetical protein